MINLKDGDRLVASEIVHAADLEAFGLNEVEDGTPLTPLPVAPPRAAGEEAFDEEELEEDLDEEEEDLDEPEDEPEDDEDEDQDGDEDA